MSTAPDGAWLSSAAGEEPVPLGADLDGTERLTTGLGVVTSMGGSSVACWASAAEASAVPVASTLETLKTTWPKADATCAEGRFWPPGKHEHERPSALVGCYTIRRMLYYPYRTQEHYAISVQAVGAT